MPQGTIRSYDASSGTGSLLDDDLVELRFDAGAMRASGLRELRIGQRVRFTATGEGEARAIATLNIVSL